MGHLVNEQLSKHYDIKYFSGTLGAKGKSYTPKAF